MARSMEKLCTLIEDELRKVSEKGITTANLDNVYKLVDMMKDLKNMDYWETKEEYYGTMMDEGGYSQDGGYSQEGGYSERRRRDSRGRYSRADGPDTGYRDGTSYRRGYSRNQYGGGYSRNSEPDMERYDRYMHSKNSYRSSKTPECKQRMMDMLEDYMDDFTHKMEELARDSDCAEEKETIMRYLRKLQDIR